MSNEISLATLDKLVTPEEFQVILDSGAIPSNLDTVQKLQTVVQTGKELGMQPMVAINNINVIKGRTVINSSMLGALLKRHGYEYFYTKDFEQTKNEDGSLKITTELKLRWRSTLDPNSINEILFSVTWAEMSTAGYTSKDNWNKYPKNMMRARCMAYAVRTYCPEVLLGFYTDMEILDANKQKYNVEMNEDGDLRVVNTAEDVDHEDITEE